MKYKGIIFDLDGVICNTDEYHYLAWKQLADRLGIPFDRERNNLLRGISRMASLDIILRNSNYSFSDEEKTALAKEKNDLYRQLLNQMTPDNLSTDVNDTLEKLRHSGLQLAIGSSSRNTPLILKRLGLNDYFDAVIDGNSITKSKPDPEVFLKASQTLKLAPAECLIVEDAHAGVQAAVAGGFDCAAMGNAKDDDQAVFHINHFSELLTI